MGGCNNKALFKDKIRRKRYFFSLLMIVCMIGISEWTGEKEIIFPEMAALTIGMWIVDKRVWRVKKLHLIMLMTLGAASGIWIVRYSFFPLIGNLVFAFLIAVVLLLLFRITLIPLVSACMLPVLLHTQSWIYPLAVGVMSLLLAGGQQWMEKTGLRGKIPFVPIENSRKENLFSWLLIGITLPLIFLIPVHTSCLYCILPPLVVTYVEFAQSKAGFRNRPVQVFLLLVSAALLGTVFQWLGHVYWGIPQSVVVIFIFICLFVIFEYTGKFFAPAGAIALIPMLIPSSDLFWFPLQVAVGAAVFIFSAMILFLKCYKWPKAYLIVCLIPESFRHSLKRK